MAFIEIRADLKGATAALERIAGALEAMVGRAPRLPVKPGPDESAVFYTDDRREAIREAAREAYLATGQVLPENEALPSHGSEAEVL